MLHADAPFLKIIVPAVTVEEPNTREKNKLAVPPRRRGAPVFAPAFKIDRLSRSEKDTYTEILGRLGVDKKTSASDRAQNQALLNSFVTGGIKAFRTRFEACFAPDDLIAAEYTDPSGTTIHYRECLHVSDLQRLLDDFNTDKSAYAERKNKEDRARLQEEKDASAARAHAALDENEEPAEPRRGRARAPRGRGGKRKRNSESDEKKPLNLYLWFLTNAKKDLEIRSGMKFKGVHEHRRLLTPVYTNNKEEIAQLHADTDYRDVRLPGFLDRFEYELEEGYRNLGYGSYVLPARVPPWQPGVPLQKQKPFYVEQIVGHANGAAAATGPPAAAHFATTRSAGDISRAAPGSASQPGLNEILANQQMLMAQFQERDQQRDQQLQQLQHQLLAAAARPRAAARCRASGGAPDRSRKTQARRQCRQ